MSEARIPLYRPTRTVDARAALALIEEVLRSEWLTLGPKTQAFESAFAQVAGARSGVAVSNATAALYLAYEALGVGPGDRVVVPALTFSATANAVRWRGGEPVFCDVDPDGNLSPDALAQVLQREPRAKVVVPVHLYGLPADMRRILPIARAHGCTVVEDCAHAPGARLDGKPVGGLGDAGCFSFYATKNLTTGEGGMLTTNRDDVRDAARHSRSHAQTKDPAEKERSWGYDVDRLGYNFRMSEIAAAMGLAQIPTLEGLNQARREAVQGYRKRLAHVEGIVLPQDRPGRQSVHHLFVVRFEGGRDVRNRVHAALAREGIVTGVHYPPLHTLKYYRDTTHYGPGDFPAAEALADRILSLPLYPGMLDEELDAVATALTDALAEHAPAPATPLPAGSRT